MLKRFTLKNFNYILQSHALYSLPSQLPSSISICSTKILISSFMPYFIYCERKWNFKWVAFFVRQSDIKMKLILCYFLCVVSCVHYVTCWCFNKMFLSFIACVFISSLLFCYFNFFSSARLLLPCLNSVWFDFSFLQVASFLWMDVCGSDVKEKFEIKLRK